MKKYLLYALFVSLLLSACAPSRSNQPPHILPVHGSANSIISNEKGLADEAVKVAEIYLNAQKNSDGRLFRTVTPHENMNIVFDWSYVNKSGVVIESARLAGISYHLSKFNDHYEKYDSMPSSSSFSPSDSAARLREIQSASLYADRIEKGGYPMLGNLLKKGHWKAVIPADFANLHNYSLMNMKYIADIKAQSKGGSIVQKRTTLDLFRLQADGYDGGRIREGAYDSGWKVLFAMGL